MPGGAGRVSRLSIQLRQAAMDDRAARIEGMENLREAALRKLADGFTTYEEVARVTVDTE